MALTARRASATTARSARRQPVRARSSCGAGACRPGRTKGGAVRGGRSLVAARLEPRHLRLVDAQPRPLAARARSAAAPRARRGRRRRRTARSGSARGSASQLVASRPRAVRPRAAFSSSTVPVGGDPRLVLRTRRPSPRLVSPRRRPRVDPGQLYHRRSIATSACGVVDLGSPRSSFARVPTTERTRPMQYMLLYLQRRVVVVDDVGGGEPGGDGRVLRLHRVAPEERADAGRRGAPADAEPRRTVRVRDGERMVTDGPFAETREQLGGYYLIEVATEAQAIDVGRDVPARATARRAAPRAGLRHRGLMAAGDDRARLPRVVRPRRRCPRPRHRRPRPRRGLRPGRLGHGPRRWPVEGQPADPGAWIMRVARNRAIDLVRRRGSARSASRRRACWPRSRAGGRRRRRRSRTTGSSCCSPAATPTCPWRAASARPAPRRRPHACRDRARPARRGGDDRTAHRPREAAHPRPPASRSRRRRTPSCRSASARS